MHKATNKNSSKDYDLHGDLSKIKAALAEATYDAKGRARELFHESIDDMKERSAEVQDTVTDYVAERPLKSIGIAMLIGGIIGYLMHK